LLLVRRTRVPEKALSRRGETEGEYWDDFSTIPLDVNGDNRTDFVTGGWWGNTIRWRENPGNEKQWPEHVIAQTGSVECTRAWDVDGDGFVEMFPIRPANHWLSTGWTATRRKNPSVRSPKYP
jgi:hypothetical protein